jgi:hypothetical protein
MHVEWNIYCVCWLRLAKEGEDYSEEEYHEDTALTEANAAAVRGDGIMDAPTYEADGGRNH